MLKKSEKRIFIGDKLGARIELFVRIVLIFVLGIVLGLWGIAVAVFWILQFLVILITGKRNKWLHRHIESYFRFWVRCKEYFLLLTDKRPV